MIFSLFYFFFFQAEDGIRDVAVTGVQTCALPIYALRGPLGIHRAAKRRFWFYGADYTLEAQMGFLRRLRKLTEEELDQFTAGKELPPNIAKVSSETELHDPSQIRARRGFCILDYVRDARVVGRNYVARCPSC